MHDSIVQCCCVPCDLLIKCSCVMVLRCDFMLWYRSVMVQWYDLMVWCCYGVGVWFYGIVLLYDYVPRVKVVWKFYEGYVIAPLPTLEHLSIKLVPRIFFEFPIKTSNKMSKSNKIFDAKERINLEVILLVMERNSLTWRINFYRWFKFGDRLGRPKLSGFVSTSHPKHIDVFSLLSTAKGQRPRNYSSCCYCCSCWIFCLIYALSTSTTMLPPFFKYFKLSL